MYLYSLLAVQLLSVILAARKLFAFNNTVTLQLQHNTTFELHRPSAVRSQPSTCPETTVLLL